LDLSSFPISFCGSLRFSSSSDVFCLRSFCDREDDDPLERLNAPVFKVLLCVSFLLSKLSFWDQLSAMSTIHFSFIVGGLSMFIK
jgi:hypothetical protein